MLESTATLPIEAPPRIAPALNALPHLVRFGFNRRELLDSFGRRFADAGGGIDLGHQVHCRLAALFGDAGPSAFHVTEQGDRLDVVAWSDRDAWALREIAERRAASLDDRRFLDAPWWSVSRDGAELWRPDGCFVVRACPVVRRSRDGAELDAFEHADSVDRQGVYVDWLRHRLDAAGVLAGELRLDSWALVRLHRRRQGRSGQRRARWLQRPAAILSGRLVEPDPSALARLLVHGLGRHRAFGFGMVRPAPARSGDPS